jgi:tripartite-type tricarboxylate transporter receptor subunit TctC
MGLTRRTLIQLGAFAAAAPVLPARADEWPSRPIKIVVGTAPGGSPDIMSRIIGDKLSERLGQSFVVENNSQGAGAVAQQLVAKSAPDGYTMLMMTAGYPPQMVLRKSTPFDPLNGFSFVTLVCGYPMVYAVRPDSPIKSFDDLLEQARTSPGRITYTINALGSIYHVLTKWIEIEAGIELTPIPYRGTAAAVSDILAGRVDLMVDAATSAFPRIQSGQLRVLALSSPQRYPLMPHAPLVAETLPKIEFMSWLGLAMGAGTPRGIVERLNQEVRQALTLPDVQQRLVEGGNVATPSTPEEMRDKVASEMARWRRVIESSGIKAE